ncbi:MAG: hypothetical protein AAF533_04500 [Acidobacteriota bacterium]
MSKLSLGRRATLVVAWLMLALFVASPPPSLAAVAGDIDRSETVTSRDVVGVVHARLGDPLGGSNPDLDGDGVPGDDDDVDLVVRAVLGETIDRDGDGIADVAELLLGTDPDRVDTDRDGIADGDERDLGRNPVVPDPVGAPGAPIVDVFPGPVTDTTVLLTGTGITDTSVVVDGGVSQVATIPDFDDGSFAVEVEIRPNRANRLAVRTIDVLGLLSSATCVVVVHDTEAPELFVDVPGNGDEVTTETVTVAGRLSDRLSGALGLGVTVDGLPAEVIVGIGTNGSFERSNVPLELGENTITVVATDVAGNAVEETVTITRVTPTGPQVRLISGDGQVGPVDSLLAEPLVIDVDRADGSPHADKLLTLEVVRSNGLLSLTGDAEGSRKLQVFTDVDGRAEVHWQLGSEAGCGNNRLTVSCADVTTPLLACASAQPGAASQINLGSGSPQVTEVDGVTPEPLRAWVSDSCNGSPGVPVTFTVIEGGGTVNRFSSVEVITSATGHAEVSFWLGPEPGNHVVEADFPGNTSRPVRFTVLGLERTPGQPTSFETRVLDNARQPIGGARCVMHVGDESFETTSDEEGRVVLTELADGPAHFEVEGAVATTNGGEPIAPGSFPHLEYELVLIPQAINQLPGPVLLPLLRPENAVSWDGQSDVVLTVADLPGLEMRITAGSMTLTDGSVPSPESPVTLSLNQVHHDDIPMPMPDGVAPPFAWTLQPGGAHFDPPVSISYPNMSGLVPGSIAYFLSFDHDTGRFEIVSSGSVTDDGSCIVTDPGDGIAEAGWGCNCPPYAVAGDCEDCDLVCLETGELVGGEIEHQRCGFFRDCELGDRLTWVLDPPDDTEGRTQESCLDAEGNRVPGRIEDTGEGSPVPRWTVWKVGEPFEIAMGVGYEASIVADLPGTYFARFTMETIRDCPPPIWEGESEVVRIGGCDDEEERPPATVVIDGFGIYRSFLASERVELSATLDNPEADPADIRWSIQPLNDLSTGDGPGYKEQEPEDLSGPMISFQPDPTPPLPYETAGWDALACCQTGCDEGNGSCAQSEPLSYLVTARYCDTSDVALVQQDTIDILRQEYENHQKVEPNFNIPTPPRNAFGPPVEVLPYTLTQVRSSMTYNFLLGRPAAIAKQVRDNFNELVHDDLNLVAPGTTDLDPGTELIDPGREHEWVGTVLSTPCCWPNDPMSCDDCCLDPECTERGDIPRAGPDGIAQTTARNETTNFHPGLNSHWRNPERNEAVRGARASRHQYGDAVDLGIRGLDARVPGVSQAELWCILLTAAAIIPGAEAQAEVGSTEYNCNYVPPSDCPKCGTIGHVHVEFN